MAGKSRIKGITIELDGEVTGLEKAMKDVTSKSIDLQGELKDVERLLKFDPGNVEALAQKQEILTKQIENTTEKLNRLKSAEEEVERQFQSGDIGEKQYRAFRREVEFTEKSIKDLKSKISQLDGAEVKQLKSDFNKVEESSDEASDSVKDLGNELVNLAAGAGAVAGLGELIEKSLDVSSLNTKIDISFDVPEESIGSVKEATNAVIAYGIDAEEALEGVRKQWALNKGYSDEEKINMTKYAAAISKAFDGIDFNELIQESYELASSLELDNDEALGLINSLLKVGFPPDQLDIITEYGSQLSRAGYSAEEIQAIMKAGVDTGSWNIDNLLDGLKEGRIVLSEFGQGIDEETAKLFNKIGISSKQVQEWGQAVAAGGKSGKDAMVEVAKAISNIDDSTLQNQIGVKVYGTLWEEQGNAIVNTIVRADDEVISLEKNQEGLNNTISSMDSDPAIKMEKAMTDLKSALQPILSVIAEVVGKIAEWISNNPTLAATIMAIVTVIGILMGIFMALSPIITAITALAGTLSIGIGAIAYPVLIVIGVITALIAIGVSLYKNWEEIKTKCSEIWTSIKDFFSNIVEKIKTSVIEKFNSIKESVSNKMNEVKTSISDIWNKVMDFFKDIDLFEIGANIIQGLINGVKSMASSIVNSVKGVVDGAIEGAKNLLGIHSPSRVFMEFGEYTGEGFINGINEMKNAVAKAGQDMADASIPNIKQPKFKSLEGKSEEVGDIILYVTNNTNLDSKLIATETTPKVIRNVTRSTTNYKRGLGGV
ncbi:MAG: phage tail tape measure protein [Clostridium sp.]|uniref:phage tail tape measure protein n=1 Tax=Clostridium sp. TaxID=1506 RepID=UPI0029116A80|nr:phage tail tape measure protein [Clostridium sp.]MDU6876348.1 phage tail tape measure protein [Clostridium sp.]MDU6937364.1 phage tail tape measure protein [Clostridium sp.]